MCHLARSWCCSLLLPVLVWVGLYAAPAASALLPAEGLVLNQTHVQFEWDPVSSAVDYQLVVVVDDGSPDPFAGATPVVDETFGAGVPRRGVTTGLAFGAQYAWRVRGIDGTPLPWEGTHRFSTAPLPIAMPTISVFPGTGTPEPGVTLFDIRGGLVPGGLAAAVDSAGAVVWFMEWSHTLGDLRFLDNGRMLLFARDGRGYEITLGGQIAWASPEEPDLQLHHEVFPMPNGNYLSLAYHWEEVMHQGELQTWVTSRIVEFDGSDNQLVFDWNPFDYYSTLDFDPTTMMEPGVGGGNFPDYYDWTHHNAVIYDASTDSIYASARQLSRITRIDHATGDIVYDMGFDMPSGDPDFGDDLFSFEHAPEMQPGGNMLLFDNGNRRGHVDQTPATGVTKVVELAFSGGEPPTGASIVWEWTLPDYVPFLGDADRLPGGHTLVNNGANAKIHEIDTNGVEVWRLELAGGHVIYRAERVPTLLPDVPADFDGDGLVDDVDNCPAHANPWQEDCDCDSMGNVCAEALGLQGACDPGCNGDPLSDLMLYGLAQGGSVELTVSGELLQLITLHGQSAPDVIDALADLINQSPALSAAGISAVTTGQLLTINGTFDVVVIADAGLSEAPIPVPVLSPITTVLLAALVCASGVAWPRRR